MEKLYKVSGLRVNYVDNIYENAEVVIVLGGDGTILLSASECAVRDIPILGVNLGRVGFMSEVEVDNIPESMDKLLNNEYRIENRMMMDVTIKNGDNIQGNYIALNDVVVSKSMDTKLIYIKLFTNDEQVNAYTADGVIVSSPTGSTGYSLSAGGPVVDPLMSAFVATPICAHMLSARSAVLSTDKTIILRLDDEPKNEAVVAIDGGSQAHIKHGDEVVVKKSKYVTKLIKIGQKSFYSTLIEKLS